MDGVVGRAEDGRRRKEKHIIIVSILSKIQAGTVHLINTGPTLVQSHDF